MVMTYSPVGGTKMLELMQLEKRDPEMAKLLERLWNVTSARLRTDGISRRDAESAGRK
ncbi:MAG TPA: hypothetical protein VEH27_15225 [Methylomirabilota bacterium]|nr:hypothetical protein [Methylomirabilota bacterium]